MNSYRLIIIIIASVDKKISHEIENAYSMKAKVNETKLKARKS